MKVAIVGSRSFTDYQVMIDFVEYSIGLGNITEVISGGARGADSLARRLANEFEIPYREYGPNWDKHGKRAGIVRNVDIISESDVVIAFWDGKSNGTRHSINTSKLQSKVLFVYRFIPKETLNDKSPKLQGLFNRSTDG